MALYSLLLIRDGLLIGDCKQWCHDDLEALDVAFTLCADQAVEVWEAGRLVAQGRQNDSPFFVLPQLPHDLSTRSARPADWILRGFLFSPMMPRSGRKVLSFALHRPEKAATESWGWAAAAVLRGIAAHTR